MVYLTSIRLGLFELTLDNFTLSNRIFIEHIFVYLLGPFRAFDHALYNFNESLGFNFGYLTFAGFDEIIGNFFRLIGDYQIMNHLSGEITAQGIDIGLNYEFNALYTCVYNYYFDLGLLGVILFPFFYGFVNHRIISNFECNPTAVSLFLLVFVSVSSITSVMLWKFQMPAAVIVLLGAYLFHLKNKKSF
jgi:oligosaccharide repeat unit polymerase